ncbi:MAG TPA: helix-turn-helix transcriptional regulator [Polyangiaceae bacterium]|nr:helix-turn-helix transcriptional regulator [Polyangiaceae bacterium]
MKPKGPALRVMELRLGSEELVAISFPAADATVLDSLSSAEKEVVGLALANHSNAQIAEARGTSMRTVANQLASAFRKLGVSGRGELVALLVE